MPAYAQRREIQPAFIVCPNCLGLPMYVRDVEPHLERGENRVHLRVL